MVGMTSNCLHGRELDDTTSARCLKASLLFGCHFFLFFLDWATWDHPTWKKPFAAWFPYATVERLWYQLEELGRAPMVPA
ncbi:hypothetical protein POPTR_003G151850v4 [Populus trichocarpa]|uniref:Uncharacterized protein n=1 Tax=Populus trichocarpa TaxID=3694 RepID=A0ACC0T9P7_POPTR|nr:hypothetical protein POPTR_003G151850v4 [Populus trichocarpa]